MDGAAPCPCGARASFAACCAPFIEGRDHAPTAETLMRSRYSAFCTGATDYLLETHRGAALDPRAREGLQRTIAETDWRALTVLAVTGGGRGDTKGTVEFVAAFRPKGLHPTGAPPVDQMHERSRFVRENGRWLYTDGERRPPHRPARNAPCWCGSGRKVKHCHL